jgi:hypothetical protein
MTPSRGVHVAAHIFPFRLVVVRILACPAVVALHSPILASVSITLNEAQYKQNKSLLRCSCITNPCSPSPSTPLDWAPSYPLPLPCMSCPPAFRPSYQPPTCSFRTPCEAPTLQSTISLIVYRIYLVDLTTYALPIGWPPQGPNGLLYRCIVVIDSCSDILYYVCGASWRRIKGVKAHGVDVRLGPETLCLNGEVRRWSERCFVRTGPQRHRQTS